MKTTKTWKSALALLLTLSMLVGMVSVLGVVSASAETYTQTSEEMKFKADFSELAALAEAGGAFPSGTTYIKPGYTTAVEKEIAAWVNERFDMITGYGKNLNRATLGQNSSTLSISKDTWSGNNYWNLMKSGYIQHTTRNSGQAYRLVESFVPKFNGEQVVLSNFEAKLTFSVSTPNVHPHGVLVAFHEKTAGYTRANGDHTMQAGTGNLVMLNNGAGSYTKASGYGLAIYDQNNTNGADGAPALAPGSAIVDNEKAGEKVDHNYYANHNIDGEVFKNQISGNTKYDLIVRVVGTKVNVTIKDMSGNVMYTKEKILNKAGEGYISFGSSNSDNRFYAIEVLELDENGKPVPFGTKTGKDEVETLKIDFADVPEVQYYGDKYYYDSTHTASDATVSPDMNTAYLATGSGSYTVNTKDAILVDYLESKLAFYYSQEGRAFERNNINGYVVNKEGVDWAGTGDAAANVLHPDTGVQSSDYVDGVGPSGNTGANRIAKWFVDSNRYLGHTPTNPEGDSMFRKSGSIAIKDKSGDLLQIDNFKLDLDFKMYASGNYDYANIAVGFHANTPYMNRDLTTQAMFAISPYGGYFFGENYSITEGKIYNKSTGGYDEFTTGTAINFANQTTTNTATNARAAIYPFVSETKIGHNTLAHLTLTVVGNTATAKVTKGDTVILEKTVTLSTYYDAGYLFLSGSNQQGWYGDIEVTRLDANGNPVDFSDDNEGWTFGESFDAKAVFYHDGKYYRNTGKDFKWLEGGNATYYDFNQVNTYADDAATVAHLNEKFNFYGTREGKWAALDTPYQTTQDNATLTETYSTKPAVRWRYTLNGLTYYQPEACGGETVRKSLIITPKVNGSAIKTRNVEMYTDVVLNGATTSVANISLRSSEEGKTHNAGTTKSNTYTKHVALQITRTGINVLDGKAINIVYTTSSYAGNGITDSDGYAVWSDAAAHDHVRVYAKLVNDKLTVKVTDSKTGATIYSVTDKKVAFANEGYVNVGLAANAKNGVVSISDLYVNVLDGKGNGIDPADLSEATDSYIAPFSAKYNDLFPYGTTMQTRFGIPAYLQTNKNINNYDYFNFTADGQHFTNKNREYKVADGYSLVTEGGVTSVKKDGTVVVSTEDYTVDSIGYKDAEETVIKVASNNAEMNSIVRDGIINPALEYLNGRFDAYYTDTDCYKGASLMDNGWGTEVNAIYGNRWLQFGGSAAKVTLTDAPKDNHISLLVPKNGLTAEPIKADAFNMTWDLRLNDSKTFGTAYFVFNMPKAGNIGAAETSNEAINFNSDLHAIKINSTQLMFWNGTEWVDLVNGYVGYNAVATLTVNVKNGIMTGSVKYENKTAQNFEVTLTNTQAGYMAIGHNHGGMNFGALNIDYDEGTDKIATVAKTKGGKLTVTRMNSDRVGQYKYMVTATPDANNQLKANSLVATDVHGNEIYPTERVGFRSGSDGDSFYFYATEDVVFNADFCVVRDVYELNMANLGTSYHKESGGLRFLSRVAVETENGQQFVLIDGKKYELVDYGMILTTQQALDWGALNNKGTTLELDSDNPYIKPVSVKDEQKFYDLCDDYMDISTRIVGLDRVADGFNVRMHGRAYVTVKLAEGKPQTVYTDAFDSTYNETASDLLTAVYLDAENGDDANVGTQDAPVKTLAAASEKVVYGGNVVNMGTATLSGTVGSALPYKLITLTGGTYKLARHTNLSSPVTFANTTIEIPDTAGLPEVLFANGHPFTVEETVQMVGKFDSLYGGSYQSEDLERTELNVYAGNYHNILGGSAKKYVAKAYITVGGNVNAGLKAGAESGSHNVGIWGGGAEGADTGDTYITFGGNAYAYMIYGGSGQGGTISGDTRVTVTGGECAQIFGGCDRVNMTGNTNVTVLAGTVTRRIYGGCYNEDKNTAFHVTGKTNVTIGEDLDFTKTGKSSGVDAYEGIRAGSRAAQNFGDEVSTLYFESATAQNIHSDNLGQAADAFFVSYAFGTSPAATTDSTVVK